ncbi:Uma2 family endonuclease [Microcystis aeruginosa]|jgi:Uma2 family endonuclease|uniref:Uma2 family endonuclease n=1 Tax=Microcystis aeruginosa TaxID=1126 RepID=UPI000468B61B|nr:Uma2 family endonuclease [Microcystis aeruginosa]MDB9398092.1 Uma2 family endonuclease [Microcystis aeruginosa CS-573]
MKTLTKSPAENYLILHPISWQTFRRICEELSQNPSKRLAYNQGYLQIMSPLIEQENNNWFISRLIFIMAEEWDLNIKSVGSLTLKRDDIQKGIEPDACFYLKNEPEVRNKLSIDLNQGDKPPDLAIEIDITSGSLDKFPIYAGLAVPEIWRYDGNNLRFYGLNQETNGYEEITESLAFPLLDITLIPPWLEQRLIIGETATLKQVRQWIKEQIKESI